MIDHLKAKHPENANKDFAYFRDLKFEKRLTIGALFKSCGNEVEKGLIASYKVSKLIAKRGKSHNIGKRNHQYYDGHSKRCNTLDFTEQ